MWWLRWLTKCWPTFRQVWFVVVSSRETVNMSCNKLVCFCKSNRLLDKKGTGDEMQECSVIIVVRTPGFQQQGLRNHVNRPRH